MDKDYKVFIYSINELEEILKKLNSDIKEMISKKGETYNDEVKQKEAEKMILKTLVKLRIALNPYIDIGNTVGYNINTYTCSATLMENSVKIDFMPICHFITGFEYIRDENFENRNNKDVKWLEEYKEHTNFNSINFYGEKEIKMEDLIDETDGWDFLKLMKSINMAVLLNATMSVLRDTVIADYLKGNIVLEKFKERENGQSGNVNWKESKDYKEALNKVIDEKLDNINKYYNINVRMKLIEFVKMLDVYIKYMYE